MVGSRLPEECELLVVRNGLDRETEAFLGVEAKRDPRLVMVSLPGVSPAAARNAALERARGEIVYFLDDDVVVEPDVFVRALATFAAHPEVGVVGGPNLTPPGSRRFERAVGRVLESRFGSATVSRRYRRSGAAEPTDDRALILCGLAVRRAALARLTPPFRRGVVCNEENILLAELAREGVVMRHDPNLIVYHSRRGDLASFCRQVFRYGRGRWQNTAVLPGSLSPVYLVPVAFLLYLASLPFVPHPLYRIPLAVYVLLLGGFSAAAAWRERDPLMFPQLLGLFPACHLGYACGFVREALGTMVSGTEVLRREESTSPGVPPSPASSCRREVSPSPASSCEDGGGTLSPKGRGG